MPDKEKGKDEKEEPKQDDWLIWTLTENRERNG